MIIIDLEFGEIGFVSKDYKSIEEIIFEVKVSEVVRID